METLLCKYPEKNSGFGVKTQPKQVSTGPLFPLDSVYAKNLENKIYNKIEDNFHISNKKALFLNMRNFYESMGQDPF